MYDLIINGYTSFDHIIKLDSQATVGKTSLIKNKESNKFYWGGCSINVSVGLSRLGKKTLPIISVGSDFEKSGFKDFLENEKISNEAIKIIKDDVNPRSFLIQNPDGEHITTFYTGSMDEKFFSEYEDEWFKNSKAALMTVGSKKDNEEFLKKVKKFNIPLYFGMKGDFTAFPIDFIRMIAKESEIMFMNETERNQLVNILELKSIKDLFNNSKLKVLVVTAGSKGSMYIDRNGNSESIGSVKIKNIVDTTGGGDAFITGFLFAYSNGEDYRTCCEIGAVVSSFVIEKTGCCTNLPNITELEKRYEEVKGGL